MPPIRPLHENSDRNLDLISNLNEQTQSTRNALGQLAIDGEKIHREMIELQKTSDALVNNAMVSIERQVVHEVDDLGQLVQQKHLIRNQVVDSMLPQYRAYVDQLSSLASKAEMSLSRIQECRDQVLNLNDEMAQMHQLGLALKQQADSDYNAIEQIHARLQDFDDKLSSHTPH